MDDTKWAVRPDALTDGGNFRKSYRVVDAVFYSPPSATKIDDGKTKRARIHRSNDPGSFWYKTLLDRCGRKVFCRLLQNVGWAP